MEHKPCVDEESSIKTETLVIYVKEELVEEKPEDYDRLCLETEGNDLS